MPAPEAQPGLQAERTQLSWERCATAVLVSGALALIKQGQAFEVGRILLAIGSILLAVLIVTLGRWRAHRITEIRHVAGRAVTDSPRTAVMVMGWSTTVFACAALVYLVAWW